MNLAVRQRLVEAANDIQVLDRDPVILMDEFLRE